MRFEFVEEVEGVASLCYGNADACRDERRENRPVVSNAMAGIEVCQACSCSWDGKRKS